MEPGAIAAGVAVVGWLGAWLLDRRKRLYADQPTTPAAAVFAGRNEVKGRAWAAEPVTSHKTRTSSVWWDYTLEEERERTRTVTTTDSQGRNQTRTETTREWHTVESKDGAVDTCEVVDDTGSVPVRLGQARVVPRQVHSRTFHDRRGRSFLSFGSSDRVTGRYRETERVVAVGDDLFVCGDAELDDESGTPVLGGKVLVSTRSEESHTRWLGVGAILVALVAAGATGAASGLLLDPDDPGRPAAWLPGAALALVLLVVGWGVIVHNRLRLVGQGAQRAWSLIDVQLARRHDLVPALARSVAAHADHERTVLESVTAARSAHHRPTDSDDITREAAEQTTQLQQVFAVAERYPQLTADQSFQRLQRELADTETRIAASRTFYNDAVTLLRDRSQSFPGVLVARRIDLPDRDLIAADGFERTVPAVERAFG